MGKVIFHMPVKFKQVPMKNEWVVGKKRSFFQKNNFKKIFGPQNPFLRICIFGQGHSAHACNIWAGSDEKWMSSLQKTVIFSEK